MSNNLVKVIDLIPGRSRPLPVVDAEQLSEETFWDMYVSKHLPVLIKGAVASWPAVTQWKRPGYVEGRCGDAKAITFRTFNPIPVVRNAGFMGREPIAECIKEMRSASDTETLSIPAARLPPALASDIGGYRFFDKRNSRPLHYPAKRIFIYKNASTEWHFHGFDETLTSQLVGSKRISLFRLTRSEWPQYEPLLKANFHHMNGRERFFPADAQLTKYEGVLEAGDSVYIPPVWWHGVDPVDAEVGMTLAHCFRSPLRRFGDWSDPVTRVCIRDLLSKLRVPRALMAMGGISLSSLSRRFAGEPWIRT